MRSRFLSYLLVLLCVGDITLAQQQTTSPNPKPEDQVMQVERDWLAADGRGDAARLQEIIADDFVGSSFNGGLLTKDDIIPTGGGPGGFAGAVPGKTDVRVFGDTGILMGVINKPENSESKQIRVMLVCEKRHQGWQIIAVQLSRM